MTSIALIFQADFSKEYADYSKFDNELLTRPPAVPGVWIARHFENRLLICRTDDDFGVAGAIVELKSLMPNEEWSFIVAHPSESTVAAAIEKIPRCHYTVLSRDTAYAPYYVPALEFLKSRSVDAWSGLLSKIWASCATLPRRIFSFAESALGDTSFQVLSSDALRDAVRVAEQMALIEGVGYASIARHFLEEVSRLNTSGVGASDVIELRKLLHDLFQCCDRVDLRMLGR